MIYQKKITNLINIPTIGIGASVNCDGQVLVTDDILGLTNAKIKFVKKYNPKIKKISYKKIFGNSYPSNTTMNMTKFKKFLKKDKKI